MTLEETTMTFTELTADLETPGPDWRRTAVVYQIYPRSFADSNGDGIGDLPGITHRLPALAQLGIDAIWLSPFYKSPQADAGYDVADYRDVDPVFGTLADFDAMLDKAHGLGLKVIVDLVPNHSSDEHEWFRQALAAAPGSLERERYMFRDGRGENGELPPNNWESCFRGPAWTRTTDADGTPGQWYLHLFDTKQPDWNWENPEVRAEFLDVLRFWLDRGVDGFRVDVAHALIKAPGLPDQQAAEKAADDAGNPEGFFNVGPMWDQDRVHEVYREWRALLDTYSPDRILCAEAWVPSLDRLARYVRDDEMHQAFNFDYLESEWDAAHLRSVIDKSVTANETVGAPTTWVLSNHDVVRHVSRLGLPAGPRPNGIRADDLQPDHELGLRRARAATLLMLALPGSAYMYQGEELGLPDHTAWMTTCGRTRPGGARSTPRPAGTVAASRCRGRPTSRGWASARAVRPGCRSRPPTPSWPATGNWRSRVRRWRCTGPRWRSAGRSRWPSVRSNGRRPPPASCSWSTAS
jgi:alpha-glucosidase